MKRPSVPLSDVEPVPGAHFGYASDAGKATNGFYCVDYVVINYHDRYSLRFSWHGTPLHADAGAALAPGGHSKDSFVYAVSYYSDPARGPVGLELEYGRDLQNSLNAEAYVAPATPQAVQTEDHLGAHRFQVEATGETVDFDIVLQTAVAPALRSYVTTITVKRIEGDIRLKWFPRTDAAFLIAAGASDPRSPYALKPGVKTFDPVKILPSTTWRVVPQMAQVWVGDTPVLDATFPNVVLVRR